MNYGGDWESIQKKAHENGVAQTEGWFRSLFFQAFNGLAHLHENAVIHCDIKEPNLMLKTEVLSDPKVVIIDLGLASATFGERTIKGTPGYIPPETWKEHVWFP